MSHDSGEPVGTVTEEAIKFLQALQGAARHSGGEYAEAANRFADGAASSLGSINEHIANGTDCKFCPLCQLISAIRATSPEVKQHLFSAATSLAQAIAILMASHAPQPTGDPAAGSATERIDLDDDADWEDDR